MPSSKDPHRYPLVAVLFAVAVQKLADSFLAVLLWNVRLAYSFSNIASPHEVRAAMVETESSVAVLFSYHVLEDRQVVSEARQVSNSLNRLFVAMVLAANAYLTCHRILKPLTHARPSC